MRHELHVVLDNRVAHIKFLGYGGYNTRQDRGKNDKQESAA
jgi:hypothetical protein